MKYIQKIKLKNFKRFKSFEVRFDKTLNILVGDNAAGKSSLLSAIDLVLSASRSKTETIGLESLFNHEVVGEFLRSSKRYEDLPELFIEIYLNEQNDDLLNGKNNSDNILCDGLYMKCAPIDELSREIREILSQDEPSFPFEYYAITFKTFSDQSVTGYSKFLRHLFIDNAHITLSASPPPKSIFIK
jgi:putative ATP-dependent endonuclease of OLD family